MYEERTIEPAIPKRSTRREVGAVFEATLDAPSHVLRDGPRFVLRKCRKRGEKQLGFHAIGLETLFFESDGNAKGCKHPNHTQAIERIARKARDRLREDEVYSAITTIVDETLKLGTVTCARCTHAMFPVNLGEFPVRVSLNDVEKVRSLGRKRGCLCDEGRRRAAIRGDTQLSGAWLRRGRNDDDALGGGGLADRGGFGESHMVGRSDTPGRNHLIGQHGTVGRIYLASRRLVMAGVICVEQCDEGSRFGCACRNARDAHGAIVACASIV